MMIENIVQSVEPGAAPAFESGGHARAVSFAGDCTAAPHSGDECDECDECGQAAAGQSKTAGPRSYSVLQQAFRKVAHGYNPVRPTVSKHAPEWSGSCLVAGAVVLLQLAAL
jgi:hypothetical protein